VKKIDDVDLADEIIGRLNALIGDPPIRNDVHALIQQRIEVTQACREHPTIQASSGRLGFLGLLNGIVGAVVDGQYDGYGLIAAVIDDQTGQLVKFVRTDR
jgi:hypothetical protein